MVRALRFARSDEAPLPGMEPDPSAAAAGPGSRELASLLEETGNGAGGQVSLMRSFDHAALDRRGVASGFWFTVRALCFHTVGHAIHPRLVIRDRYL